MEYVKVTFPESRRVRIDGQVAGVTNRTLMVERGHHKIDLGSPSNYHPEFLDQTIENTTGNSPLVVEFSYKEGEKSV
jgi:hypothetical protein